MHWELGVVKAKWLFHLFNHSSVHACEHQGSWIGVGIQNLEDKADTTLDCQPGSQVQGQGSVWDSLGLMQEKEELGQHRFKPGIYLQACALHQW